MKALIALFISVSSFASAEPIEDLLRRIDAGEFDSTTAHFAIPAGSTLAPAYREMLVKLRGRGIKIKGSLVEEKLEDFLEQIDAETLAERLLVEAPTDKPKLRAKIKKMFTKENIRSVLRDRVRPLFGKMFQPTKFQVKIMAFGLVFCNIVKQFGLTPMIQEFPDAPISRPNSLLFYSAWIASYVANLTPISEFFGLKGAVKIDENAAPGEQIYVDASYPYVLLISTIQDAFFNFLYLTTTFSARYGEIPEEVTAQAIENIPLSVFSRSTAEKIKADLFAKAAVLEESDPEEAKRLRKRGSHIENLFSNIINPMMKILHLTLPRGVGEQVVTAGMVLMGLEGLRREARDYIRAKRAQREAMSCEAAIAFVPNQNPTAVGK